MITVHVDVIWVTVTHDDPTGGPAVRCDERTPNTAFKDAVDDYMSMSVNKGRACSLSP